MSLLPPWIHHWKMHENERIWTPREGACFLMPPLDPPIDISVHRFGSRDSSHSHMSLCSCTLYSKPVMTSLVHVQLLRSAGSPHVPMQLHFVLWTGYDESGYGESHTCTATQKPRFPTCPHTAALCTPNQLQWVRLWWVPYSYSEAQVPNISLYSCAQIPYMSPYSCAVYSWLVMMSPIYVQLLRSPGSLHVPIQLCYVLLTGYDEFHTCTATQKPRFPTCPCTAALCTPNRLQWVRYI